MKKGADCGSLALGHSGPWENGPGDARRLRREQVIDAGGPLNLDAEGRVEGYRGGTSAGDPFRR